MNIREEILKLLKEQRGYQTEAVLAEGLTELVTEWALEMLSTHTEHDGSYCDTGEDMEWGCRSECVAMAMNRIEKSTK